MSQTLLDILLRGGILMVPIIFCSIVGIAIILDRAICFRRLKLRDFFLPSPVREAFESGKVEAALANLRGDTAGPAVLREALDYVRENGPRSFSNGFALAAGNLIHRMERHLRALETVASVSPLLGLLGTVFGMIRAFMAIEAHGATVNATVLAGGIWEALLTTAAGLSVAIPCMLFHGAFQGRLEWVESQLEALGREIRDVAARR